MNRLMISETDYNRLNDLIKSERGVNQTPIALLTNLAGELKKAVKVDGTKLSPEYIRMHSQIKLQDLMNEKEFEITLVFPHEAEIKNRKISILAPIGTALIGYKEGDLVEWEIPSGIGRYLIKKVS